MADPVRTTRLVSILVALGAAVVMVLHLGVTYGPRALVVGAGLVCLGWLLHDDSRPAGARRDLSP